MVQFKRHGVEQYLTRKQWSGFAGVPEAKPTKLNTIG
jgi:hypothetical protein